MTDPIIDNSSPKALRNGVMIYGSQEAALSRLLNDLEKRVSPKFALIADTSGQPILSKGELEKKKLTILGALVAGDLAASQEMAKVFDQYNSYQLILREGKEENLFISEIGQELILLCLVPTKTPLGWARLLIRETAKQMAEILKTPNEEIEKLDFGLSDSKLADLCGDSLNNIWNG
jgi:predicted regulator of Ras-like GTPase activity (Roadblock/LC7/MglB family)